VICEPPKASTLPANKINQCRREIRQFFRAEKSIVSQRKAEAKNIRSTTIVITLKLYA
jgi:hypothetical protein